VVDYLWKKTWSNKSWDPLGAMRDNGMNWVRVGVEMKDSPALASKDSKDWSTLPSGDSSYWSSKEYALAILKEATEKGYRKDLFLFLSPNAASGAQQDPPPEWTNLSVEDTSKKLEAYCYETVKYYVDKNVKIDLYDMGNEIERGILKFRPDERIKRPVGLNILTDMDWMRKNVWNIEATLLKSAIAGVKRADPSAKITLHGSCLARGSNNTMLNGFYQAMSDYGVPYDVIGVSYYWNDVHSDDISLGESQPAYYTTQEWKDTLKFYTQTLKKTFIFSEYVYTNDNYDGLTYGNDIGYPYTPQGQQKWIKDFLKYCHDTPEVSGCIYFYPEYYPTFQSDPAYDALNAFGLFGNDLKANAALKEFNKYQD